ncbi:GNAT family N-acetyltransferase [Streptomyces resistomycificus]|uniref:GNAT family N-acetyltransferase n=1 Tax=Streptomyces resistomycificus TaxID=67356 RepID=UPI000AA66F24|nr:GNAT family N-acetyltransferase [Streptomyces resistomycificus]
MTPPTTGLRPAGPDDLDAITDLHSEARTAYYRAGGWSEPELTTAETWCDRRAAWQRALTGGHRHILCALRDGDLTGVVSMGPPADTDLDATTAGQLYQIHVRPDCWGQGVGSRLHAAYVRFLHESSLHTGVLEAWERNTRAHAFYARHGWHQDGHRRPGPGGADYVRLRLRTPGGEG